MKNLLILLGLVLVASACEKCADCKCSVNISNEAVYHPFTQELVIPASSKDSILSEKEICAKGKDLDTETEAFSADTGTVMFSKSKNLTTSSGTSDWIYDEYWVTTCSCNK